MTLLSAGIINETEFPVQIPTNGLRAFYPLVSETVTATAAQDVAHGHDIPRHGVSMTQDGAQFDGIDDWFGYADIGTMASGTATISFWVDTLASQETPIAITDSSTDQACTYYDDNEIFISGTHSPYADLSLPRDTHIIFKKDSSGWAIKTDNNIHDTGGLAGGFTGNLYFFIGMEPDSRTGTPSNFYQGTIHDVAFYDRYTTDSEDTQLYNNPST